MALAGRGCAVTPQPLSIVRRSTESTATVLSTLLVLDAVGTLDGVSLQCEVLLYTPHCCEYRNLWEYSLCLAPMR